MARLPAPVVGALAAGGVLAGHAAYRRHLSETSQALGSFPYAVASTKRVVALTFDDGPNEPYTSALAEMLEGERVRATFFAVGRNVERAAATTRALADAGHVIGNHSYHHELSRCWTRSAIRDEVERTQEVLGGVLGRRPALFRPPWLARTRATFDVLDEFALTPVSGRFCHPLEVAQIPAERIARRTLARVRPGSMVIFHDGYDAKGAARGQTVAAAGIVIRRLKDEGYRFVTADELLEVPAYQ